MRALVIDALARASGKRYATFDVVGVGPRLVAGLLIQLGIKTDLKTYEHVMENEEMIDNYDIVLISAMSSDREAVSKLAGKLSRYNVVKILGGPIGLEFYELLASMDIDLVIIGEAENQLIRLFTEFKKDVISKDFNALSEVKGLAYKAGNKIVFTGFSKYVSKDLLNKIKPYTLVDKSYEFYWARRFYVEVVRGCSNFRRPLLDLGFGRKCIKCLRCSSPKLHERLWCPRLIMPGCGFCSVPFLFGPPRSRNVHAIVNEVRELIRHGARRIVLSAPDFLDYARETLVPNELLTDPCYPRPNYHAIEYLLKKLHEIPEVYSGEVKIFIENIKACLVDEKIAEILGQYIKGTTIHIGLETASDKYNETVIGKPITLEHVVRAVELLTKYGLRPYVYLIYGLPYMDAKVYRKTIKTIPLLYEKGVEKITLYKFSPLPLTSFEFFKPQVSKYTSLIKKLKNVIIKHNLEAKKKLLGKTVKVYVVKVNHKLYGYPEEHGPVVFVKNDNRLPKDAKGALCKIVVTDIRPRYVYGNILEIIEVFK